MAWRGPGRQASEGGLSYLQVLPPHVHCCKSQLHLLPTGILVSLVGDLNENQEDPSYDASSHQHEDPCVKDPVCHLPAQRLVPGESIPASGQHDKPTCHVLKGESGWCIAAGVTLLIANPCLIQVFHEAILVGPG